MSSESDFDGVVDNPESSEVFWVRYEEYIIWARGDSNPEPSD